MKGKDYYYNDNMAYEVEYLYGRKWNIKAYDINNNNILHELKNRKGFINEFGLRMIFSWFKK